MNNYTHCRRSLVWNVSKIEQQNGSHKTGVIANTNVDKKISEEKTYINHLVHKKSVDIIMKPGAFN